MFKKKQNFVMLFLIFLQTNPKMSSLRQMNNECNINFCRSNSPVGIQPTF